MVLQEEEVLRVLYEEKCAMATVEVSKALGGKKAKEVKHLLDALVTKNKITKSCVNKNLYWTISDPDGTGTNKHDICSQTGGTESENKCNAIYAGLSSEKLVTMLLEQQREEIAHLKLELSEKNKQICFLLQANIDSKNEQNQHSIQTKPSEVTQKTDPLLPHTQDMNSEGSKPYK